MRLYKALVRPELDLEFAEHHRDTGKAVSKMRDKPYDERLKEPKLSTLVYH